MQDRTPEGASLREGWERFDRVRSIAVLTASGIGDFLVRVPALEALRTAYPGSTITVLGDTWHPAFLEGRPGPWDGAVSVPRTEGLCRLDGELRSRTAAFVAEHRGRHDLVVQMQGGGAESTAVVRALEPRFSVGARTPAAEPLTRDLPYVDRRPEVLRWLEVAELAGAQPTLTTGRLVPRVAVTDQDRAGSRLAWDGDEPFVVVHAGARDPRRCWSPARFAAVALELRRTVGTNVVLVGTRRDRAAASEVAQRLGSGAVDLTERLSLGAMLGLASRSALFIGNDSGPRHVAIAAGIPTVGIFWVGNVLTFGPLVGGLHRAAVSFTVNCPVCGRPQLTDRCEHAVSFVDDVTVEEVLHECALALASPAMT